VVPGAGPPARLGPPPGGPAIDLNALVAPNLGLVVVGLAIVALIAFVVALLLLRRVRKLEARLGLLTRGEDGRSLESVLGAHLDRVLAVSRAVDDLGRRTSSIEVSARSALQRVGIVRYNPFEETGGNQSFALALLDAEDHGIIVSSLHARSGTRVYAKAVTGGRPAGALSEEEAEALRLARGATKGRPAVVEHAVAGPAARV
jgi:uncharacterized protein DUF4446